MLITITTIEVVGGKRDELLARAKPLVSKLRAQKGVLDLQIMVDHETLLQNMSACRPDVVTMVRKWDNEKNLAGSFGDSFLLDFIKENRDLLKDSQTRILISS